MDKGILSNINPVFDQKKQSTQEEDSEDRINLFSNSFATNISSQNNDAENEINETRETEESNLLSSLGVPTGVSIEGFNYNSFLPEDDIVDNETTETNSSTNPIEKIQQFQENKVSGIYKMMNKDIIYDLTDLISKF